MLALLRSILWPFLFLAWGLATGWAIRAAPAQAPATDTGLQPMIFFAANGGPNACGPGCSEWIAAEGEFDQGAEKRLRDLLASLGGRNPPIYFQSTGGIIGQARVIGRILRARRMTASVGKTVPEGCRASISFDEACLELIRSKRELKARLTTAAGECFSACVYALVGASARHVAERARVGIHARRPAPDAPKVSLERSEEIFLGSKRYMLEMGVDPGLVDAAQKIPPERMHILSREELSRYGIETRDSYETNWMPYLDRSKNLFVLKSLTQARGADAREYRTTNIRVACAISKPGLAFWYVRELPSNEIGVPTVIQAVAGNRKLVLDGSKIVDGNDERLVVLDWDFLRTAVAAQALVLTETFTPPRNSAGWSREVKLSTAGLSQALEAVLKGCGGQRLLDLPRPMTRPDVKRMAN
jgi:hypothetical protein